MNRNRNFPTIFSLYYAAYIDEQINSLSLTHIYKCNIRFSRSVPYWSALYLSHRIARAVSHTGIRRFDGRNHQTWPSAADDRDFLLLC